MFTFAIHTFGRRNLTHVVPDYDKFFVLRGQGRSFMRWEFLKKKFKIACDLGGDVC